MSILANCEDLGEVPQNAAFHQGLHFLLRQKRSSVKEMQSLQSYLNPNHVTH